MIERERKALAEVVNYLWADEQKDFDCNPAEDHIFHSLQVLKDYLAAGMDDTLKALALRTLQAMQLGADEPVLDEFVSLGIMQKVHGGAYGWTEKGKLIRVACGL